MSDAVMMTLVFLPLFGLFALFIAVLYFRSRHNSAHPAKPVTPDQIDSRFLVVDRQGPGNNLEEVWFPESRKIVLSP